MSTRRKLLLPTLFALGSFSAIATLTSLTQPLDNLSYALLFFGLLGIFLVSVGHFLTIIRWGEVSARSRSRILIVSILIIIGLMLRSLGSLSALELVVLVLIGLGLWFYSGRRAV